MSFKSEAQELVVVDPDMVQEMPMSLIPLEVFDNVPSEEPLEVCEDPGVIEIVVEELPGAPPGTKDPEPVLEVEEEPEDKKDENDLQPKKPEKWDWATRGSEGFITWVKERIEDVPKHSGLDTAGLERACSYLEKLDSEISKAMRMDLDGELDANKIEDVRSKIDDGLSRLHDRLDKIKSSKKKSRKKKAEYSESFVKEAQKITGVSGIVVTVPLLISRIARVCINGTVSAGHDINYIFQNQVKKYKLNDREKAETIQLLHDMGYPVREDRGYFADDDVDTRSSDNFD